MDPLQHERVDPLQHERVDFNTCARGPVGQRADFPAVGQAAKRAESAVLRVVCGVMQSAIRLGESGADKGGRRRTPELRRMQSVQQT